MRFPPKRSSCDRRHFILQFARPASANLCEIMIGFAARTDLEGKRGFDIEVRGATRAWAHRQPRPVANGSNRHRETARKSSSGQIGNCRGRGDFAPQIEAQICGGSAARQTAKKHGGHWTAQAPPHGEVCVLVLRSPVYFTSLVAVNFGWQASARLLVPVSQPVRSLLAQSRDNRI